ncbi:PTS sugar transporter subunit IIA [Desulfonatronovibrio hydrogenovorans]|uniref:PTS sugar transporter subunit IIA n=1 Tax=Desulfonatronovibrio hydrogenovorans TaxID=53245 RepID=UPI000491B97B|nr:PTS sugar transporter subunit IIA [Desulfonatronovibrio hydrogenovorans]
MNLDKYIHIDQIIPELSSGSKNEILAELIAPLVQKYDFLSLDKVYDVLLTRENLGTTGIGEGVAIPHGKLDDLEEVLLVAGRSLRGVNFSALDHKPVHIFFMVLAPEKSAGKHLKILAYISRLLQDPTFKESFMRAQDREELWNLITKA